MNIKFAIFSLATLMVIAVAAIVFLFSSSSAPQIPVSQAKKESLTPGKSHESSLVKYSSAPDGLDDQKKPALNIVSQIRDQAASETSGPYPAEKQVIMDKIQEAMSTYSAEGVPILKTYLTSPDIEIREYAIEAMKQIDAPEAAAALREAFKKTTDPRDRQAMLEAADFVDLPAYNPTTNR
jgi:hypothetical protein